MTAHELTDWVAYEQVYGSLLPHERIDAGFAQVSLILAQAFGDGRRRYKMRDFMPAWFQDLTRDDELARGMAMMKTLGVNDADDLDADR